jgi:hypothetical protein
MDAFQKYILNIEDKEPSREMVDFFSDTEKVAQASQEPVRSYTRAVEKRAGLVEQLGALDQARREDAGTKRLFGGIGGGLAGAGLGALGGALIQGPGIVRMAPVVAGTLIGGALGGAGGYALGGADADAERRARLYRAGKITSDELGVLGRAKATEQAIQSSVPLQSTLGAVGGGSIGLLAGAHVGGGATVPVLVGGLTGAGIGAGLKYLGAKSRAHGLKARTEEENMREKTSAIHRVIARRGY